MTFVVFDRHLERIMLRLRWNRPVLLAAIGMMVCALQANATTPTEASAPALTTPTGANTTGSVLSAIWRTHSVNFDYHSTSVQYSCSGLRNKIGSILRAIGAHDSLSVEMQCNGRSLATDARAQIVVRTPVEATEENVRIATDYDGRDRLVARMRNVDLPGASDIQRFAAEWRTISLSRDRSVQLDSGDCDLLRGMREQVFPKLSIQVTRTSSQCATGTATRMRPKLEVVALVPLEAIPVAYAPR
jgi:hypothetical protein